ncbi:MAG: hypothetical protein COB46_06810 [Rhodospirillaceae bacterium]|nr:MAG: hypothetical protein COB46_06810 [Rhodospirillaceae bacterium]
MKVIVVLLLSLLTFPCQADVPNSWRDEFPLNDFTKMSIDISEVMSGGPPRDGIPPIDNPLFAPANTLQIPNTEPVIGLHVGNQFKAYPVRMLMWHEIVNDVIGNTPVTVTFCPLCNAAIVFDRRVQGRVLDFGTTGKLRFSDLIMYDRQTETFFQQAIGEGIVGDLTGVQLKMLPARLESFANYKARAGDDALVLVPNSPSSRAYGKNPYAGYDEAPKPFLYRGELPSNINPMLRVVTTGNRSVAYTLDYLREQKMIRTDNGTVFRWSAGQNTALGSGTIAKGRDVGNVTAKLDGKDVVYFVEFAFVYHAFNPAGKIEP